MSIARHTANVPRLLMGAAAAATCLVLLGQIGRWHQLLDQLNSLLPLLLPALALFLAAALRLGDRATIGVAALGLIFGSYQLGGAALRNVGFRAETSRAGLPSLKILTLSTCHSNPDPGTIRKIVAAEAPDIAVLQETSGSTAKVVDGLLPRYHRIKSCKGWPCPLTILSRWPIGKLAVVPNRNNPEMMIGDVEAPFGRFRIINVHLPRPYDKAAGRFIRELARISQRHQEATRLIVAGDFNTASGSFGLARFAKASRLRQRNGFIPTYPANQPIPAFVGIDHVFADHDWSGGQCRRMAAGGSDHYGVVCRLQVRKQD
jgi:endonuclease/exonuclease/phosphatase (EEP) superfamily protein YafD